MNNQHNQRAQALIETLLWGVMLAVPLVLTGGWAVQRATFSFTGQWLHHFFVRDAIYQKCRPPHDNHRLHETRAIFHLQKLPGFQSVQFVSTPSATACQITTSLRYHFGGLPQPSKLQTLDWQTQVSLP